MLHHQRMTETPTESPLTHKELLQPDREQLFFRHLPEAQAAVPLSDHLSELIDLWLLNKEEVFSADWGTVYPPPPPAESSV